MTQVQYNEKLLAKAEWERAWRRTHGRIKDIRIYFLYLVQFHSKSITLHSFPIQFFVIFDSLSMRASAHYTSFALNYNKIHHDAALHRNIHFRCIGGNSAPKDPLWRHSRSGYCLRSYGLWCPITSCYLQHYGSSLGDIRFCRCRSQRHGTQEARLGLLYSVPWKLVQVQCLPWIMPPPRLRCPLRHC